MQARQLTQPHATERLPTLGSRAPAEPSESLDRARLPKVAFLSHPSSTSFTLWPFTFRRSQSFDSFYKCLMRMAACQKVKIPKLKARSIILVPLAWNGGAPRMLQHQQPDTAAARKEENQCVFLLQGCTCQCLSLRREAHPTLCTGTEKNRLEAPL